MGYSSLDSFVAAFVVVAAGIAVVDVGVVAIEKESFDLDLDYTYLPS
ncbi:hypothetical protein [Bacillus sp. AFS055030]|nr:hypothetical protein [Bacillus sp. AFS055030]